MKMQHEKCLNAFGRFPSRMSAGRDTTCASTTTTKPRFSVGFAVLTFAVEPAARSRMKHKQMLIFTNRSWGWLGRCVARCCWAVGVVLGWVLNSRVPPLQSSALRSCPPLPGCFSIFGEVRRADPEGVRGRFANFARSLRLTVPERGLVFSLAGCGLPSVKRNATTERESAAVEQPAKLICPRCGLHFHGWPEHQGSVCEDCYFAIAFETGEVLEGR